MRNQVVFFLFIALLTVPCAARAYAGDTPTGTYQSYRSATNNASALSELKPLVTREKGKELDLMTPEQQVQTLQLYKALVAKDIKIDSEKIEGDRATLTASGKDPLTGGGAQGVIILLREDDSWKIDSETWSSKF